MLEDIRKRLITNFFTAMYDVRTYQLKKSKDQNYKISLIRADIYFELLEEYFENVDIVEIISAAYKQAEEDINNHLQ